ncbi:MAG: DUF721 domain-containing protein [Candidatus Liberibacter solanacearum]
MIGIKEDCEGMMHFSEIIDDLLDPFLRRRAGISISLIGVWSELVGDDVAKHCKPEKIIWPRRDYADERDFSSNIGGILVIACEGPYALFLMHDQSKIIRNVNVFFGFCAIKKIRFLQKPVGITNQDSPCAIPSLRENDCKKIEKMTEGIKDEPLKKALVRFGHAVIVFSYL